MNLHKIFLCLLCFGLLACNSDGEKAPGVPSESVIKMGEALRASEPLSADMLNQSGLICLALQDKRNNLTTFSKNLFNAEVSQTSCKSEKVGPTQMILSLFQERFFPETNGGVDFFRDLQTDTSGILKEFCDHIFTETNNPAATENPGDTLTIGTSWVRFEAFDQGNDLHRIVVSSGPFSNTAPKGFIVNKIETLIVKYKKTDIKTHGLVTFQSKREACAESATNTEEESYLEQSSSVR